MAGTCLVWRGASRQTRTERFHNLGIVDCSHQWTWATLGVAYQQIRTKDPTDHRIAWNPRRTLWWGTAVIEAKKSLDEDRWSMNVNLDIPLPR